MNYQTIYQILISRGKNRLLNPNDYYETHHIIPRCLGGSEDISNLVDLTPEEHYVAHQLLVKLHPGNHNLVKAAVMMIPSRPSNKLYGWLRRKHSVAMSASQSGDGNSQFGSIWIFNQTLKENKKIKSSDLTKYAKDGWEKGRVYDFNNPYLICEVCKKEFRSSFNKKTCSNKCHKEHVGKHKSFIGREEEFKKFYAQTKSMNKALKLMGFPGAISHYYHWAKSIL